MGSHAVKTSPGISSPEGGGGEKGAGQNPDVHPGKGMSIPQVVRLEKRLSCGVGSSSGESADEGEDTPRRPPVIRESARCHLGYGSSEEGGRHPSGHGHGSVHGGEPVQGQEGTSVGGQSPDDESGAVLEEIGNEGRGWSSNSA